jgi:hypothetical protein
LSDLSDDALKRANRKTANAKKAKVKIIFL